MGAAALCASARQLCMDSRKQQSRLRANVISLSVIIVIPSKMVTQWVAILRGNPSV